MAGGFKAIEDEYGAGNQLPAPEPETSYRAGSFGAPMTNGVQAPYSPFDFAADAAWKFVGQPLYNIASGKLMRDVAAPRDQTPLTDMPRTTQRNIPYGEALGFPGWTLTEPALPAGRDNAAQALGSGMEAGGMAALGSFGGARAASAPANTVYHYGTAPVGGRFDASKSAYSGDVFVSPQKPPAPGDANPGAMSNYIRQNYDGYYQNEGGAKNIGIHRPNSLFNPDGSTFYANNKQAAAAPAALDMAQSARMQRARDGGFNTGEVQYRGMHDNYNEVTAASHPQWFSNKPQIANTYLETAYIPEIASGSRPRNPQVLPAYLREGKMFEMDALGSKFDELPEEALVGKFSGVDLDTDSVVKRAAELGYDSVRFRNLIDQADIYDGGALTSTVTAMINPSNIRSVNAAFDPAKAKSPNLMAANPFQAAGVPLMWDDVSAVKPEGRGGFTLGGNPLAGGFSAMYDAPEPETDPNDPDLF